MLVPTCTRRQTVTCRDHFVPLWAMHALGVGSDLWVLHAPLAALCKHDCSRVVRGNTGQGASRPHGDRARMPPPAHTSTNTNTGSPGSCVQLYNSLRIDGSRACVVVCALCALCYHVTTRDGNGMHVRVPFRLVVVPATATGCNGLHKARDARGAAYSCYRQAYS